MTPLTSKRIVFTGLQQVALEACEAPSPGPGKVRIATRYSLMSTGTENIVFNRLFEPGTHWDNWVKYPFYPGYAVSGIVEAVGEGVRRFAKGDPIVARAPHQQFPIVAEHRCYPLPEGIPFETAPWFALAKIAFLGAIQAQYKLGSRVAILGAGPIGQMSLRWALASGATPVVVVDGLPEREPHSMRAGGTSAYIAKTVDAGMAEILAALAGREPDIVVDTTGNAAAFASAMVLAATSGRVVLIGDAGSPGKQALTSNMITKNLTVAAAHDMNRVGDWDDASIIAFFFQLVKSGRFRIEGLNTHCLAPEACLEAYSIANKDRARTMGILFDWESAH